MSIDKKARHNMGKFVYEEYLVPGFNYRMTDIQGAIGVEQMKKLPKILAARRELAERYNKLLLKNPYIELPSAPAYAPHTWQAYLIKVKNSAPISVQELMQKLIGEGIGVKRGIMACHLEHVYEKTHGKTKLPVTEKLIKTSFCIPIFPQMTKQEQDYIIAKVNKYLR